MGTTEDAEIAECADKTTNSYTLRRPSEFAARYSRCKDRWAEDFLRRSISNALALSSPHAEFHAGLRPLELRYKGQLLRQRYTPDFVCFEKVIVELKAVREIAPEHRAQLVNYLRATSLAVGLLVNFGPHTAKVERVVLEAAHSA